MYRIGGSDEETLTPVGVESLLGYHPCSIGFPTESSRNPAVGQCPGGEFDWSGRLRRGIGGAQDSLRMVGNHSQSAGQKGSLTATPTGGAGTKVGPSDPVVLSGNAIAQRIIRYPWGCKHSLSLPRVHIDGGGLATRCRLIAS